MGAELRRNPVPVGSYNVQSADGRVLTPSLGHGLRSKTGCERREAGRALCTQRRSHGLASRACVDLTG